MHRLLDKAVAAEPGEVHPVAELPFHIAPLGLAGGGGLHGLDRAGVIGGVVVGDIPDGTIGDLFERRLAGRAAAPAETTDHRQSLGLGLLGGGHDAPHPGNVHAHGFFTKDVFPGSYRGLEVPRPESGRSGQQHDIHAAGQQLLISIQAKEGAAFIHGDTIAELLLQAAQAGGDGLGKDIGHGKQFDVAWAAPVPRPPQPIRPILRRRLSGAPKVTVGKATAATRPAAPALRTSRRGVVNGEWFMIMSELLME